MRQKPQKHNTGRIAAFAAVIGAVLASSCCVLPLVLVTLGVSGAWIGKLSALAPYNGYFVAATLAFLSAGFWWVYLRKDAPCDEDSYCANPASNRFTKNVLWMATLLALLALTVDWWAPLFY